MIRVDLVPGNVQVDLTLIRAFAQRGMSERPMTMLRYLGIRDVTGFAYHLYTRSKPLMATG